MKRQKGLSKLIPQTNNFSKYKFLDNLSCLIFWFYKLLHQLDGEVIFLSLSQIISTPFLQFYQVKAIMGCGTSENDNAKLNKKRETVFGVLEVRVIEAIIEHETSKVFSMDPYVNIKFSNQNKTGVIVKKGGKNPKFNDVFQFTVNSLYKYYGRCLEVEVMDSNTTSDSLIGYGIIDLDPYLNTLQVKSPTQSSGVSIPRQPQVIPLRCFLNFDRKQAGFISLSATFRQEVVDYLSFRFETVQLKRSTRAFGEMNCYIRVTVGQQILETKKCKDTKTLMPNWKDDHMSFTCPKSIEEVLFEVMDDDQLIGSLKLKKLDFIKQQQQSFDRQFFFKDAIAGKLKFNSLTAINPIFKELNGDYKKKLPDQTKKEDKKQEKKEENKENEKKQQKKQQKKQDNKEQKKQDNKIQNAQLQRPEINQGNIAQAEPK